MKKTVFWAFTILFPVFLFLLLELGLRLGGYSEDAQELFVEVAIQPEYVVVNPAFVSRYFPAFTPDVAKTPFLKEKDNQTFRVFVLGGSSTQGFPYNFYSSFSSQLQQRLQMETVGLNVEVINLGMTAVNSFVLWDLSKRLVNYDPDAILIYAGHNEYYGSFGVGSTQFGFGKGVGLKRLILNLKNWRLYQLIEDTLRPDGDGNSNNRTLMARVVKESGIPVNSELYQAGVRQFEKNLSDVLKIFGNQSVPVFVGTVTSNLKDQPPLGDGETALSKYSEGNDYFDSGFIDSARVAYLKAKEYDDIRFRAPEKMNDVIRKATKEYKAYLVDVNSASAKASESSIQDSSFFIDHLHPDWEAHQLIANLYFESLRENMDRISEAYAVNPLYDNASISEFEEIYANVQVKRLKAGYPFKKGLTGQQEFAQFQNEYNNYLSCSYIDSIAASSWRMQRDIPLALTDVINYENSQPDTLSVLQHYRDFVHWQLFNTDLLKKSVNYAINDREYDSYSVSILHTILSIEREDPFFANTLAALYLLHEDLERSEFWLQKVKERDEDSILLWYSYARLYALKGDTTNAKKAFEKYIRLRNEQ